MDNQNKIKLIKSMVLIVILTMLLSYVSLIDNIPSDIVLIQGEKLEFSKFFGLNYELENSYTSKEVSSKLENVENARNNDIGKANVEVSLFGKIPVKNIEVNVIPKTKVIPLGNSIGMKLYTSGVLVVGMTEISGVKPYKDSGIKEGDMIVEINDSIITCTSDLIQTVNKSMGENLEIKYSRDGSLYTANMTPIRTSEIDYKLGLWVRDGTAGVGMVSFYEPSTKSFAALGHGILDIDTEKLITISSGDILNTKIISIKKGEKGNPGELRGSLSDNKSIGTIYKNTNFGVFGKIDNISSLGISKSDEMEIALRDEIKLGDAKIICTLKDNIKKEFDVKITSIYKNNNYDNKSMVIKVTDKELLEETGGIIQRYVTGLQLFKMVSLLEQ